MDKENVDLEKKSVKDKIDVVNKGKCGGNFTPFVLLIGLGVHSVFEGLALGLEPKEDGAFLFGLAIALHKGAAGMSLGISMQRAFPDDPKFVTIMITLFAIFSPFGVILGIFVGQETNPMIEIVFNCLAGGTFLYIACSEVIVEEFSNPKNKYLKLFFFIVGIAMIAVLYFLE